MLRSTIIVLTFTIACESGTPAALDGALDAGGTDVTATLDAVDSATVDSQATDVPTATQRVLFVGNSYTYFNELPEVVRSIGESTPGIAFEVEMIAEPGAQLYQHLSETGARERIETGDFDAVVLQAQSLEPALDGEAFFGAGGVFAEVLRDTNTPGVWFSTWARRPGDEIYNTRFRDPEDMTKRLEDSYIQIANMHDGTVARVGAAFQIALRDLPEVELYQEDGSHPSPAGSLLAACVIARTLSGVEPILSEPPPLGIPSETARALCAISPPQRCLDSMGLCDGACVDLSFNTEHCGECGNTCGAEEPCRSGVCGCAEGLTACGGRCIDTETNSDHCGECDNECVGGTVCGEGACSCPRALALSVGSLLGPSCGGGSTEICHRAAHDYCSSVIRAGTPYYCYSSGLGPPGGHLPSGPTFACVQGDVEFMNYTELAAIVPTCDGVSERRGQACTTAVHRYCIGEGRASGFGPVKIDGEFVTVTCLRSATLVDTTREVLLTHSTRCDTSLDPVACGAAAWSLCTSLGHPGGYGPVEVDGDNLVVVCLEP